MLKINFKNNNEDGIELRLVKFELVGYEPHDEKNKVINVPCLFVEDNYKYINTSMLFTGVLIAMESSESLNFYINDINSSYESIVQLFLVMSLGKGLDKKTLHLNCSSEEEFNKITEISSSIDTLKQSNVKMMKKKLRLGELDEPDDRVLEATIVKSERYLGKKLVVIDTHSFFHRFYHAMTPKINKDGENIALVHGFKYFLPRIFDHKPDYLIFADEGANSVRKSLYKEYKMNRDESDEDLKKSIEYCKVILSKLGVKMLSHKDFEADDVIASVTKEFSDRGGSVIVFSPDKDLYQLHNPNKGVFLYNHFKKSFLNDEEIFKKFKKINVNQIRDSLALQGDVSDNVPGVTGIGPATAAKLLNEYSDVPNIIKNIKNMKKGKTKDALESSIEILLISRDLVTLFDCLAQDILFSKYNAREIKDLNDPDVLDYILKVTT